MQTLNIKGTESITEGELGLLRVSGAGSREGDISAAIIDVDGSLACYGSAGAKNIICNGVAKFTGSVDAENIDIYGRFSVDGDLSAQDIQCSGLLCVGGTLKTDALHASGSVFAEKLNCTQATILSFTQSEKSRLMAKKLSVIDRIEANSIKLAYVEAKHVRADVANIGPGCAIENLCCTGVLYLHPDADVGCVTGGYTLAEWK